LVGSVVVGSVVVVGSPVVELASLVEGSPAGGVQARRRARGSQRGIFIDS
jgi:hypothetical protein